MTKRHGRRAVRPLATGVMGPTATTTRHITIPIGPSISFAGFTSPIKVREKSPFEKCRPNVKIEITPDERRILLPCGLDRLETHLRLLGHGGLWHAAAAPEGRS